MPFMTHPIHGAHIASSSEVDNLVKNGWGHSTPEKWLGDKFKKEEVVTPSEVVAEAPVPVIETPQEPPRRGPGRPPKNSVGNDHGYRSDSD